MTRRLVEHGMMPGVAGDQVDPAEAAAVLRAVLVQMADPESELTGTAAMRHRIEGAAAALDSLAVLSENDRMCDES